MDSSLESRCRLKNKLRLKQELIQLLAAYTVDAYCDEPPNTLATQIVVLLEDIAKTNQYKR